MSTTAFALAAQRSIDAIFTTDPDGTITYVNSAFEALYGFAREEAVGRTPRILKSDVQDGAFYAQMWRKLLANDAVVPYTAVNRTKDGRLVQVEATANPILDEHGSLVGFLAIHRDVTERLQIAERLRASERELRASEARYRELFDNVPIPTWVYDLETLRFLEVNEMAVELYGYSRDEFLRMTVADIRPPGEALRFVDAIRRSGGGVEGTCNHRKKDGTPIDVEIRGRPLQLSDRRCWISYAKDVTRQQSLENQLRQAQKMEAVGRLAGGVAHDFNNVMAVILSSAELASSVLGPSEPVRADLEEIRLAALRAADLTRQLLAFSRKQVLEPQVVDLNRTVASMERMLHRLLGEDIDLASLPATGLWNTEVDPNQIEQVLLNLAVNARDAMPRGGKLTIETANVELDGEYAQTHAGVQPGAYVLLAVSDTGIGMDHETQQRIFEPFFTTKEKGRGTGLGLATVFGIVKQSGGHIWVYSEPGQGTTFKVYFPRAAKACEGLRPPQPSLTDCPRGNETVLLVEDDEKVRAIARTILRRAGYVVLEAANAGEAVLLAERHGGGIDLLLTDVVLPLVSGRELADRLARERPNMKVLCMSGYTDDAVLRHGILTSGIAYLQKPFTPGSLTRKLREVLGPETAS